MEINYLDYYQVFFKQTVVKEKIMESVICIDGVVGAGKTTLGEILAKDLDLLFFKEPVDNNPLLDRFYYDQKRYSFPIQIYFLNKRFKMLKEAAQLMGCIMDRSIYGDVIFARLLMEGELMSKEEYHLYEELLFNMLEHIERPKLMVYLDITVENAIARIHERGREFEKVVERSYWESLNQHYKEYFKNYNLSELLVIDVNELDVRHSLEDRNYVLELIKSRL
ncbi:Deoxyadenosine/deoxycytidine kinase [Thermoflexibacter ruber]|uniref:Deoxyadenosine/deoxycytidine kinase n=2 Tax=Thermoflexibacter ruber TaxID=1003 RepID=A0A1I2II76_9BACT|nr:Deoxyadenosine/deoxycytidine kinase [Thermoflexibacter ruber]